MRIIVTDKVARCQSNFRVMIEIELPCCGTTTTMDERAESIGCETCGVVLGLEPSAPEALPLVA